MRLTPCVLRVAALCSLTSALNPALGQGTAFSNPRPPESKSGLGRGANNPALAPPSTGAVAEPFSPAAPLTVSINRASDAAVVIRWASTAGQFTIQTATNLL